MLVCVCVCACSHVYVCASILINADMCKGQKLTLGCLFSHISFLFTFEIGFSLNLANTSDPPVSPY